MLIHRQASRTEKIVQGLGIQAGEPGRDKDAMRTGATGLNLAEDGQGKQGDD
jgi:hypothetical protein